jgi:hypothetical protein
MTNDAHKRHGEDIMRRAWGQSKDVHQSEVFGTGDLGHKVQSAVSNADKQIDLLEKIKDQQAEQLRLEMQRKGVMLRFT